MATPSFDVQRLEPSQYEDLNTIRGRAAFIVLVIDYMEYLRADSARHATWDEAKEMDMAKDFLYMVDTDRGWPLARQVVPEFQKPAEPADNLPSPLVHILEKVAPRLPLPPANLSVRDRLQRYEEMLAWRTIRGQLEYLTMNILNSELEVERALTRMRDVLEARRGGSSQ
ncbi:hypothetical protein ABEF93_002274 [Exophiala dermatitidis]